MKTPNLISLVHRCIKLLPAALLLSAVFYLLPAETYASEPWSGVDEAVVEKFAREHGRQARDPIINTDQGDLLLFVFLVAGVIGGFAAGYTFRMLTAETPPSAAKDERSVTG